MLFFLDGVDAFTRQLIEQYGDAASRSALETTPTAHEFPCVVIATDPQNNNSLVFACFTTSRWATGQQISDGFFKHTKKRIAILSPMTYTGKKGSGMLFRSKIY
jgi:hypothetical protein